jgi:hypothetical protein
MKPTKVGINVLGATGMLIVCEVVMGWWVECANELSASMGSKGRFASDVPVTGFE